MKQDTTRQKIYLAALLHDIGKFYQRASNGMNKDGNNLENQSTEITDYICPKNKNGYYSHQHVIWTNEFFEKKNKVFNDIKENGTTLFSVNKWSEENEPNNIANLASYHHQPQTNLQKIIQIADWWSAGIDRTKYSEEEKTVEHHTLKFKSFKEVPLFSVFNLLEVNNKKTENSNIAYQLKSLELDKETIFPGELQKVQVVSLEDQYANLWNHFFDEFDKLPTDSFSGFEESLLFLLRKYTWAIPSNTMDMANVSLFDHLKTTASIADSLYAYYTENPEAFDFSEKYGKIKPNHFPVMLFGVDLSGIQSFIYDIASSKAAKSLKGRSFYLQLLADAMLLKFKIHKDIQARSAHVLYASGGKFYMLLPNTQQVKNAVQTIKEELEKELWQEHKGKISVNISCVAFAYRNDFKIKKSWLEIEDYSKEKKQLKDLWKLLADKITQQKEQKFKSLLINSFDDFFDEKNKKLAIGGDVKTCAVTGEELDEDIKKFFLDREETVRVKQSVYEQTELGKVLKDADFLIAYKGKNEEDKYLGKSKAKMNVLGTNFYLFDKHEVLKEERKITSADFCQVNWINKTSFLNKSFDGHSISYGFQFYGGNKQAIFDKDVYENNKLIFKKGDEKTFQYLAKTDDQKNSLLGILRMDIDNLGKLFIKGVDDSAMSFSAYSTFSFHLDLFFSGYLNNLRNSSDFKEWLNILYSGGDDLFVVGRWDKTIAFAELVRKEFAQYTKRPEIGISGGIAFVHEKFPISKAADMAGDAEFASKKFPKDKPFERKDKNAITFFGETVSWNNEFDGVKKYKNKFVEYIENNGLSKGILHKIMLFAEIKKRNEKYFENGKSKKIDYSYVWNTAYYLKRFAERFKFDKNRMNEKDKKNKPIYEFIMGKNQNGEHSGGLQQILFADKRNYDIVALAARWAEMELKYQEEKIQTEN